MESTARGARDDRERAPVPRPVPWTLPRAALLSLAEWSLAERPAEACGWLLGPPSRARSVAIVAIAVSEVVRAPNLAGEPTRAFELAAASLVAADRAARARDLEVIGIWHSHPGEPGAPSPADRAWGAAGWLGLIVELLPAADPRPRAWTMHGGTWREHALHCGP